MKQSTGFLETIERQGIAPIEKYKLLNGERERVRERERKKERKRKKRRTVKMRKIKSIIRE